MKHTPGPWIIKDDDLYDHVFTQSKPHRRIACVYGGVKGSNEFDLENQANARLIAAAPEMLEALQSAMRIKDLWLPSGDVSDEHAEEAKALSLMAMKFESVIKKSTGTDAAQTSARGEKNG